MNVLHIKKISEELKLAVRCVEAAANLLVEGATVPFIARYRKEATGSLDEVAITAIRDRLAQLKALDERRQTILSSLEERQLLTDELKNKTEQADSLTILEDISLPYRPKRRTRATVAKERGLEPLAKLIFDQLVGIDPFAEAKSYVNPEKEVPTADDSLAGARDIIAEWVNEDQQARVAMRQLFLNEGKFVCKVITGKETDAIKYKNYYDWQEPVAVAPSHRILAMRRGESEGFLILRIVVPEDKALNILENLFVKNLSACAKQVKTAIADSFKRLLSPSMETETRLVTKQSADAEAIRVFAENLRQLLLASPLGQKNMLAIDPGFRTGCKIVCLDRQGKLLHNDVIYPTIGNKSNETDTKKVTALCEKLKIEAIA